MVIICLGGVLYSTCDTTYPGRSLCYFGERSRLYLVLYKEMAMVPELSEGRNANIAALRGVLIGEAWHLLK